MTVDIEQQLSEYTEFLDSTLPTTDAEAIVSLAGNTSNTAHRKVAPGRPRKRWVVAVVAFALAIIMIGGVSLLNAPNGQIEPSDQTVPMTLVTPSTVAPDTTPDESSAQPIQGIEGSVIISARWTVSGSAIEAESGGGPGSSERQETVWYLNSEKWRRELTVWREGNSTELQGAVTIVSDGEQFDYYPRRNEFEITEYAPSPTEANPHVPYDFSYECDAEGCVRFGGADALTNCAITEDVVILGQVTTQYSCSGAPEWDPNGLTDIVVNIDSMGRTLKATVTYESEEGDRSLSTYEILNLDTNPTFDASLFEFDCPTEDCSDVAVPLSAQAHPMVGRPVPDVAGELLGGGTFDIADRKGERIILLLWASWCPPCTQDLADLQQVSADRPDLAIFTGAVLDSSEGVSAAMNDMPTSLPVIDLYSQNSESGNYLDEFWGSSAIPVLAFIDETGTIVAMWEGSRGLDEIVRTILELGW